MLLLVFIQPANRKIAFYAFLAEKKKTDGVIVHNDRPVHYLPLVHNKRKELRGQVNEIVV